MHLLAERDPSFERRPTRAEGPEGAPAVAPEVVAEILAEEECGERGLRPGKTLVFDRGDLVVYGHPDRSGAPSAECLGQSEVVSQPVGLQSQPRHGPPDRVGLEVEGVRPGGSHYGAKSHREAFHAVVGATRTNGDPSLAEAEVGRKSVRGELVRGQGLHASGRHAVAQGCGVGRSTRFERGLFRPCDDTSQHHHRASDPGGRVEREIGVDDPHASRDLAREVERSPEDRHITFDAASFGDPRTSRQPHGGGAVEELEGLRLHLRGEWALNGRDLGGDGARPEQKGSGYARKGRECEEASSQCGLPARDNWRERTRTYGWAVTSFGPLLTRYPANLAA